MLSRRPAGLLRAFASWPGPGEIGAGRLPGQTVGAADELLGGQAVPVHPCIFYTQKHEQALFNDLRH